MPANMGGCQGGAEQEVCQRRAIRVMARKTQVPIALKIKALRVFSLFLRQRQIKFGGRLNLAWHQRSLAAHGKSCSARRPVLAGAGKRLFSALFRVFSQSQKKPRPAELTGADGGRHAHAIGLRKGESFRLAVRWKQVIASSDAGTGYLADVSNESDNCRVTFQVLQDKPNFSITTDRLIGFFLCNLSA
jgi:hypothetical protein